MTMPIYARTLAMGDARIAYDIAGPEDAEAIVLLHPAFADRQLFEGQISAFATQYRVIAIDLPGHGETHTWQTRISVKDAPDIIAHVLSDNGISSCHLVGVSLGSLVAQAFADRYPELTRSVTVVGGYSIHRPPVRVIKAQRKEILRWLLYLAFSMRKFRHHVMTISCVTEHARALFSLGANRFVRKSIASMAGLNKLFRHDDSPAPYPLLILFGEHDLPIVIETSVEWHVMEPDSEYAIVAGAGHCANADAPEAFNSIVSRFIGSVDH